MSNLCIILTVVTSCVALYAVIFSIFRWLNPEGNYYFDAQDLEPNGVVGRVLPVSAKTGTFETVMKYYLDLAKLLVTVAAASITFAATTSQVKGIFAAKLILAFSILFGMLFCAAVLYRYEEYAQNVKSYTRWWYCTVESLGFATLASFIIGYAVWAICLMPSNSPAREVLLNPKFW